MPDETNGRLEELVMRCKVLGASDDYIAQLTEDFGTWDEDEQNRMFRLNDVLLAQEFTWNDIAPAELSLDGFEQGGSVTPAEQARYDAEALQAQRDEDWGLLGLNIQTILDTIGGDSAWAERLAELERSADKPRTTLLASLDEIATVDDGG